MRLIFIASLVFVPALLGPQGPAHTASDSALIGRILLAEDRRDSTDAALAEGARDTDARIQTLARRARARIADAKFASRDSFPALPAPPSYAEPAWRLRFRALAAKRDRLPALP